MFSQYNILYNLILIDGIYNSLYFGYIKYNNYHWTSREIIRHSNLFKIKLIDRYTLYIILYILFDHFPIFHIPLLAVNNPIVLNTVFPTMRGIFEMIDNIKLSILKMLYTILIIEHVQFTDINPYHIYSVLTIDNMIQSSCNYILFIIMTFLKHKNVFYYYYKLVKYLYYYNSGYKYETKNLNIVLGYFAQVTDHNSWIIEINSPLFANCLVLIGIYNQFYSTLYYDIQYKIFQHTFLWTFSILFNSYLSIILLNILFDYKDKMWLHIVRIFIIWCTSYTDTYIIPCLGCILINDKLIYYIKKTIPDLHIEWDFI